MARQQYQVITFDNRGTGQSDKVDAPMTLAGLADDAVKLLDELKIPRAHVFGVSMGGMIAQELALNYPDHVITLILGCTNSGVAHSIKPDPEAYRLLFNLEYMKNLTPEQRSKAVWKFAVSEEFASDNVQAFNYYHKVTTEHATPTFIFQRQAEAIGGWDSWDRLPHLNMPVMIITGTSDRIIPYKNSDLLRERIPNSELTMLQDKRHFFFIEAADSTKAFINGFIKRKAKKPDQKAA
jgi:pimeloyl-ACP methyl ester carboxylesterase